MQISWLGWKTRNARLVIEVVACVILFLAVYLIIDNPRWGYRRPVSVPYYATYVYTPEAPFTVRRRPSHWLACVWSADGVHASCRLYDEDGVAVRDAYYVNTYKRKKKNIGIVVMYDRTLAQFGVLDSGTDWPVVRLPDAGVIVPVFGCQDIIGYVSNSDEYGCQ